MSNQRFHVIFSFFYPNLKYQEAYNTHDTIEKTSHFTLL